MENKLGQEEIIKAVNYWVDGAKEDIKTAKTLFENKIYHYCLFFCHLTLEKLLKALIVKKTKSHALPTHNLLKLASDVKLVIEPQQRKDLSLINEFNIRARYNDYKKQFYKKATKEYASFWLEKCEEFYIWLTRELKKK